MRQLVGRKIREARKHAGLSVRDLAELCRTGERVVWYWEAGRRIPDLGMLCRIAAFTDTSLGHLLLDVDEHREELAFDGR
jgi:transcriptional regulator with XRE-family HTH domain